MGCQYKLFLKAPVSNAQPSSVHKPPASEANESVSGNFTWKSTKCKAISAESKNDEGSQEYKSPENLKLASSESGLKNVILLYFEVFFFFGFFLINYVCNLFLFIFSGWISVFTQSLTISLYTEDSVKQLSQGHNID